MTDGPEISEIKFSELSSEFRIDSVYYQKKYLEDEIYLTKLGAKPIKCFVTDGQHGYHELDESSPIHMLTAKNAKNWFADLDGADRVSKWVDENNKRSSLQEHDLILSTRGTVGCCALVKPAILPANLDQDLARIKILDDAYKAEYVLAYLKCRFGQDWMKRNQTGMVQQGLPLQKVRELPVPYLNEMFQNKIADLINQAYGLIKLSNDNFALSYSIINDCLNINYCGDERYSVKSLQNSYTRSGRLDAEYYKPKYEAIENSLKNFKHVTLKELGVITPGEFIEEEYYGETGINYIRGTDITDLIIADNPVKADVDCSELKTIGYDDLAFAMIGSVGNVAINKSTAKGVVSNNLGTISLFDKKLAPYVLIYLTSETGQCLFEKYQTRTAQPKIKREDVANFIIPIIDEDNMILILEKTEESFRLRKEAKLILDKAIRTVETAIETDETTALLWSELQ